MRRTITRQGLLFEIIALPKTNSTSSIRTTCKFLHLSPKLTTHHQFPQQLGHKRSLLETPPPRKSWPTRATQKHPTLPTIQSLRSHPLPPFSLGPKPPHHPDARNQRPLQESLTSPQLEPKDARQWPPRGPKPTLE
jgi:hypothetical protein